MVDGREIAESFGIPIIFGMIGIFVGLVFVKLYESGIVVDELVRGTITTSDVQTMIFLIFVCVGLLVSFIKRR